MRVAAFFVIWKRFHNWVFAIQFQLLILSAPFTLYLLVSTFVIDTLIFRRRHNDALRRQQWNAS